ncbi:hypothetical protein Tco_0499343 [Tanacetum coccineum]
MKVEESLNVTFDEIPPPTKLSPLVDDDVGEEEAIKNITKVVNNSNEEDASIEVHEVINIKESKNHLLEQVIGNLNQRILRSQAQNHKTTRPLRISTSQSRIRIRTEKAVTSSIIETKDTRLDDVLIRCDNKGAFDLSRNPVQYSRTKHIEIRHHFLRDNVQKGNISIEKVASEDNIADILTKPLKREVFNYLRLGLGMMELIMDSDPPSSQK